MGVVKLIMTPFLVLFIVFFGSNLRADVDELDNGSKIIGKIELSWEMITTANPLQGNDRQDTSYFGGCFEMGIIAVWKLFAEVRPIT